MNINNPTTFSVADLTYSTSNSSGTSGALRADDQIDIFDTTVVSSQGIADSAATGSVAKGSRRDHTHGNLVAFTLARLYGH